jgi:Oxidoreductase molybdopterin binding domain
VKPSAPGAGAPPRWWPRFSSPLRSTALTARLGAVLGVLFGVCFVTGLLSHYQYEPWRWLPSPAAPVWGYRVTQGLHVVTGIASIPLLLVKLWSVYPNLFRWPAVRSVKNALERGSVAVLVATALLQVFTGLFNTLNWYPWPWSFVSVHRFLSYVVIGSILLHIAVKLPDITYGLKTRLVDGDVLTEKPWSENPASYSNNENSHVPPPVPAAISRRGLLTATGAGIGLLVATNVGQTLTPLEPIGLLAVRQPTTGPQGVPVNKTADAAGVRELAMDPAWQLTVDGPRPYRLSLAEIEAMADQEADFPISCVEGWSVGASWGGIGLLELVRRAGGTAESSVELVSLQPRGSFTRSTVVGPQVSRALLATHVNGERLNLDHGYPLRLIAPARAGVLNTKWLRSVTVR